MQRLHGPAIEVEPVLVICDEHAGLVDWNNVTVHLARAFFTVDADGSGNKAFRIHHVRRAARVNDAAGIWQLLHQQAGSTGMIEVNMRQEDEVDVPDVEILLPQAVEKKRDAVVRPGIDKRAPATLYNEVTRVL